MELGPLGGVGDREQRSRVECGGDAVAADVQEHAVPDP